MIWLKWHKPHDAPRTILVSCVCVCVFFFVLFILQLVIKFYACTFMKSPFGSEVVRDNEKTKELHNYWNVQSLRWKKKKSKRKNQVVDYSTEKRSNKRTSSIINHVVNFNTTPLYRMETIFSAQADDFYVSNKIFFFFFIKTSEFENSPSARENLANFVQRIIDTRICECKNVE